MMDNPRIIYTPHPDATPEGELNALATVYAFVLQKHHERLCVARPGSSNDDAEEFEMRRPCQTKL